MQSRILRSYDKQILYHVYKIMLWIAYPPAYTGCFQVQKYTERWIGLLILLMKVSGLDETETDEYYNKYMSAEMLWLLTNKGQLREDLALPSASRSTMLSFWNVCGTLYTPHKK